MALSLLASSTPSTADTRNLSKDIVINIVGDVHGESAIDRSAISTLKKYFTDGNLNIFNLETAVTSSVKKEEKEYNFKTDLTFLKSLRSIGFNIATVANNHSFDFGEEGFLDTLHALDESSIKYVGGGVNSATAYQGQVFKIKGIRIGILGIAKVNGGPASIAGRAKPGTTNGYDVTSTQRAIIAIRKVSDVLIILAHWGEEGSLCPRPAEITSAKSWQSLGADIIVGSHTHTLQPISLEKNRLLAYSMGNFIFYSSQLENRSTGILKIRINPNKKISYSFRPLVINNLTKVPEESGLIVPTENCPNQANTMVR